VLILRKQIQVRGIVQSVGFRPFVYALAQNHGLRGNVRNNEYGVLLDVEGPPDRIDSFVIELGKSAPALAQIDSIHCAETSERAFFRDFRIIQTVVGGQRFVPVAADAATCAHCLRELFDPADRRYRYPFINCTNCGPRFTIIEDVPYDRAQTTMREFEMCAACRREYEDPLDRRFHAEPTACAECGPEVRLVSTEPYNLNALANDAVVAARSLLQAGNILAIKGIGGFHLACDALNQQAVQQLRSRKYREDKPFAVMAGSVNTVRTYCEVSSVEEELLTSIQRPIVLLPQLPDCSLPLAIAPGVKTLGFMLPYTPLHHLLLEKVDTPIVMTSANISDEPICYEDKDAMGRLAGIADYYLLNNRRIHMRTDDSVVRVPDRESRSANFQSDNQRRPAAYTILRRARGYAPLPIKTRFRFGKTLLACGAELKNTFCLGRDDNAFISHHIGDLENLETLNSFTNGIEHFKKLLYLEPEVVAYDLHPEYLSTKYALGLDEIETKIGVQHHHAHIASCMADNEIDGAVIGVAMDGLGFGLDRRLWGGEFFVADLAQAERVAHLAYVPMPGGTKAVREPWRMAVAYLQETFGIDLLAMDLPFIRQLDPIKLPVLQRMMATGANTPETSSMGRLFDAVSSLLRLRDVANYEGQAAIELEQIAAAADTQAYRFDISSDGVVSSQRVIRSVVEDILDGIAPGSVSARFHSAVANLVFVVAQRLRENHKLNRVVMSGGVFQNQRLLNEAGAKLMAAGFEVFSHHRVPANDGGLCLGQAAVANALLTRNQL
jgi:hydrogenase maturation protein HypF